MKETVLWVAAYITVLIVLFFLYKKYFGDRNSEREDERLQAFKDYLQQNPKLNLCLHDKNGNSIEVQTQFQQEQVQEFKPIEHKPLESPTTHETELIIPQSRIPIKGIKDLAKKIAGGKRIRAKKDLELQSNYPKELEAELLKIN